MLNTEKEFRTHLESLSKEEIIELCLYWKRLGTNQYWLLNKNQHESNNLMTEL